MVRVSVLPPDDKLPEQQKDGSSSLPLDAPQDLHNQVLLALDNFTKAQSNYLDVHRTMVHLIAEGDRLRTLVTMSLDRETREHSRRSSDWSTTSDDIVKVPTVSSHRLRRMSTVSKMKERERVESTYAKIAKRMEGA